MKLLLNSKKHGLFLGLELSEYLIPEVRGDLVADVAKTLANSRKPMTLSELSRSFEGQYSPEYVRRAAIACSQLKLAIVQDGTFACNESDRDDLKKATKSELCIPFRKRLQDYAPFLLFVDILSKQFSSIESAMRIRGILNIAMAPKKLERTLKGWGKYAQVIEELEQGKISICIETEKLLADYVKKLVESLEAEISAKIFTIDMLGPEVFAYLDSQGISLTDIAQALRNYEKDPKPSASRACEIFEAFIHSLAQTKGIFVPKPRPTLNDWCEGLRSQKEVPSNLLLACHGLVGIRNMTHHNPDAETGRPWNISKQAALTSTLLVPILIRSVYLYSTQRNQEF